MLWKYYYSKRAGRRLLCNCEYECRTVSIDCFTEGKSRSSIQVSVHTIVTNLSLAVDFIRTYSDGFIINEKVERILLRQYRKDNTTAPTPEYWVKITADDKGVMIFSNEHEKDNRITLGKTLNFSGKDSSIELVMQTLHGHQRNAEAFFIVAMDKSSHKSFKDIFPILKPMKFNHFFRKYSEIADYCEDTIIVYEVINDKNE